MAKIKLFAHQEEALGRMHNGCILNGGVGSGKSLTSIAYYYTEQGGEIIDGLLVPPCEGESKDLYIITTAQKRDKKEWESELIKFDIDVRKDGYNVLKNKIVIDSWNNISKYKDVENAFFIFDEQRVVGYGCWTQAFLNIASHNEWILLSATPGDCWMDYLSVFIANGYYKNKSDFLRKHVVFSRFAKYPKVERYINEARLNRYRRDILVKMDFNRHTVPHHTWLNCNYDKGEYDIIKKKRWNIYKNKPIETAGEYCLCLRRCVNSSVDRQIKLLDILDEHPKALIFYSFDYELDILKSLLDKCGYEYAEWNGHKHQPIPMGDKWVYLVEYVAGCEGWNCLSCDTMIFYSQNYSYKVMVQASGRIDRANTPFTDLYYYHFKSDSDIDAGISKALKRKKKFNEKDFAPDFSNVCRVENSALYEKEGGNVL